MTRRVAAVDCGTNSVRLLIADVGAAIPAEGATGRAEPADEVVVLEPGERGPASSDETTGSGAPVRD